MTDVDRKDLSANAAISKRDKAQHTKENGLDAKNVRNGQYQDSAANRQDDKA
jgi:hypothetical protein